MIDIAFGGAWQERTSAPVRRHRHMLEFRCFLELPAEQSPVIFLEVGTAPGFQLRMTGFASYGPPTGAFTIYGCEDS